MSSFHSQNDNSQFQIIEQPLGVKFGVITASLGLIVLELWWFIFSKSEVGKWREREENQFTSQKSEIKN